jgi:ketosteroid isomerase-like protein
MDRAEMDRLIEAHIAAESAGDVNGAVAMYTDDVVHDVVGMPSGPLTGPDAAKGFYEMLTANVKTERMDVSHA